MLSEPCVSLTILVSSRNPLLARSLLKASSTSPLQSAKAAVEPISIKPHVAAEILRMDCPLYGLRDGAASWRECPAVSWQKAQGECPGSAVRFAESDQSGRVANASCVEADTRPK